MLRAFHMADAFLETTKYLRAWMVPARKGQAPSLMQEIMDEAGAAGAEVVIAKADLIFGADHLRTALYHALRAIADGTNSSSSLAMETLLYASGERQLSSAIKKMSVGEGTEEIVVAQLTDRPVRPGAGWSELPDMEKDIDSERLLRFGIARTELETVKGDRTGELVLERVASVDVTKK